MQKYHKQQGYTLVEAVVVICVIALIVGGAFAGTHLIHKLRLNKVVEQAEEINQQVQVFRDMYKALPGDFDRAAEVWGLASNCSVAATGKATCNGDGNGLVNAIGEQYRLWQHLANAELYAGGWTGVASSPNYNAGKSVPAGPLANSVYMFYGNTALEHRSRFFAEGNNASGAIIAPNELAALDAKFDDGVAGTGRITAINGTNGGGNCLASGNYDKTNFREACVMENWMQ